MPFVFSYGTLQLDPVQRSTFGRQLPGQRDELPGFEPSKARGESPHANVTFNGRDESRVSGTVFELTDDELAAADTYEQRATYIRIAVILASGKHAWVYVDARGLDAVETERLLLRPWREEDEPELQRLFRDPDVRGGRAIPPDRVARFAEGSVRQWHVNGFGPWAAIDKATGAWIGRLGLDHLEDWPGDDKIEVGFELHKAWWGRGLATEGARAALEFGFEQHGLERIISVTAAAHTAARRVMEKAGLTYRGTRTWMNPDVPVVWYAIERAAWKATTR